MMSANATSPAALLVRANLGDLSLKSYGRFQSTVHFVVRRWVEYEVTKAFSRGHYDELSTVLETVVGDRDLLQVSSTIAANPWIEVFEPSDSLSDNLIDVVMEGLHNVGAILDAIAQGRNQSTEILVQHVPVDPLFDEPEIVRLGIIEQALRDDDKLEAALELCRTTDAVRRFSANGVNHRNFSAVMIPATTVKTIRHATIELANFATWTSERARLPFAERPDV